MSGAGARAARGLLTAFAIWFVHFVLCWAVVETWPGQWRANVLAWVFTTAALGATGVHYLHWRRADAQGEVGAFTRRFARGGIAIATVAIVFTALPSVVFLP
jgi:hypothetical protein